MTFISPVLTQLAVLYWCLLLQIEATGVFWNTWFHLCFLQIMLSCWLHQAGTFSLHLGGLQPCITCWDENHLSNPDLEAMVFDQKRVACPLQVGGEILYLKGKMEPEIDRPIGATSTVVCWTVVVK